MSIAIGVIAATSWEAQSFIRQARWNRKEQALYEGTFNGQRIILLFSGMGKGKAELAAKKLLSFAPRIIFSVGFAGALKEGIAKGDLVLDQEKSDPKISKKVLEIAKRLHLPLHAGAFYTSPAILDRSEEKKKIGAKTGAIAVDMESSAIFEVCRNQKALCCFLRSISDTIEQDLPPLVFKLYPEQSLWKLFKEVGKTPRHWFSLFKFFNSVRIAERNLSAMMLEICTVVPEK